jgi:hypothetical protein
MLVLFTLHLCWLYFDRQFNRGNFYDPNEPEYVAPIPDPWNEAGTYSTYDSRQRSIARFMSFIMMIGVD